MKLIPCLLLFGLSLSLFLLFLHFQDDCYVVKWEQEVSWFTTLTTSKPVLSKACGFADLSLLLSCTFFVGVIGILTGNIKIGYK
jgi:hypothetical protein